MEGVRGRGHQFDPQLLDLFLGSTDQLEAIRAQHPDTLDAAPAL